MDGHGPVPPHIPHLSSGTLSRGPRPPTAKGAEAPTGPGMMEKGDGPQPQSKSLSQAPHTRGRQEGTASCWPLDSEQNNLLKPQQLIS